MQTKSFKPKSPTGNSRNARSWTRDDLALAVLKHFADDQASLELFLDTTGLPLGDLRAGMADGSVQAGLLGFLVEHDDLLVAVAKIVGGSPADVAETAFGPKGRAE